MSGLSRPIVLAGPPCSGKTTCGREAARLLGIPFCDLDDLISEASGRPAAEVLSESGESAFRRVERRCLLEALRQGRPVLLAVGGGTLLDHLSLEAVLDAAILITLRVPDEVLASRLGSPRRPLAVDRESLLALLDSRRAHYESLPHGLECGTMGVAACAELIASTALRAEGLS